MKPQCYVIAGPNGSGKTTFAREFLQRHVHCVNFVNPDLIAMGLSPFDPGRAMTRAGRLVLQEIRHKVSQREDFAFETTLAGRTYLIEIKSIRDAGYAVHAFYVWIPSPELAISRIRDRVESGGHNVPDQDVHRRFGRSLKNLLTVYRPLFDTLHFFDNATVDPRLVFRDEKGETTIYDKRLYASILREVSP
jgi:predicted ABC-type ATPase